MSEQPPSLVDDDLPRTGLYLFCFARSSLSLGESDLGLGENQQLLQFAVEDVSAICYPADLTEFNGPGADARLQDVGWVGPLALRHQQVVERVMQESPVLPCRFGTLFSSPAALLDLLGKLHSSISPFLEYIADKDEWGIKGILDTARADAWLRTSDPVLIERHKLFSDAPGRRYFQEKQLLTDVSKQTRLWTRDVTQRLQQTLSAWAIAVHPLRLAASNGVAGEMLFNNSLLVPRNRGADLRAGVKRLNAQHAERGVSVELSGPWPPYSFSPSLEQDLELNR